MNLSNQETATVLAALRYWQANVTTHDEELGTGDVAVPAPLMDYFNDDDPLIAPQIDALCEKINSEEDAGDEIRAIAEQNNLAIFWFDEDYVRSALNYDDEDEHSDSLVQHIVSDLAGDAGVIERIAEEVTDFIYNYEDGGNDA